MSPKSKVQSPKCEAWVLRVACCVLASLSAQAGDLTRGVTFQDGQRVSAAELHSLVDNATVNSTFYTSKPLDTQVVGSDYFLLWSTVAGAYEKVSGSVLLLGNTNLISSQVETQGGGQTTNYFLLSYDANAGLLYKINFTNLLNFGLGLTNEIAPTSNTMMLVYDGGFWQKLTNGSWHNPTNFPLLSSPTNDFAFALADLRTNGNGAIYRETLAGAVTNAFSLSTSNLLTIPTVGLVTNSGSTNFAYGKYQRQSFTSTNFPSGFATAQTNFSFAHGLPGTPQSVRAVMVCTSADIGYFPGDEVPANYMIIGGIPNISVAANSTNVDLIYLGTVNAQLPSPTSVAQYRNFATNKWSVKVYATWESQ